MEIKEISLEEKYDKLLDGMAMTTATNYALHKELGTLDKLSDLTVKVQKNMSPSILGIALKVLKTIAPGRTFKKVVDSFTSLAQAYNPLSNIELTWVSDREAVVRTKNCVFLKRMRDVVKKADLDIDPRIMCETESKIMPEVAKEFGIDLIMELEENGCITTAKLK